MIMMNRREFMAVSSAAVGLWPRVCNAEEQEPAPARIAVIGVGGRGTSLLKVMLQMPNVSVPAICDIDRSHLIRAIEIVSAVKGYRPKGYGDGPYDYRRMLERNDFDGVLIATPAQLHAEMSVDSLNAGKHVGSEVPGAYTIDECQELVKSKEKSGRRYMLLENYTYDRWRMMVMNMVHAGVFGDITYAECSYIHDCRNLRWESNGELTWRGKMKTEMFGNTYPTHAIGPVAKWLDINNGDRMASLVSRMCKPASLHAYAVSKFGGDSPQAKIKFKTGDHCVTLIKTAKDRLISVFYDSDSPRPLSVFYLVQGTEGVYDSRMGVYVDGKSPPHKWESQHKFTGAYEHEYWRTRGREAASSGHGGGDYFVISDFVEMVRQNREPFVDVYDSAAWSSIAELSAKSISSGGSSVEMPDFTSGRWERHDPARRIRGLREA